MRFTRVLTALTATTLFAACTQEEMFQVENLPQEMEEVVGTRFLGSNLSVNVEKTDGTQTRFAEGLKGWDKSDQIGLGWVPYRSAEADQTSDKDPGTKLYANHSFDWNEDAGMFTSHGNFYQGWHFAYYPWEHMIKVGGKIFTVNPGQKKCGEGQDARYLRTSQALFISHRQFVTPEMVTKDNTIDAKFDVQATTNMISVNTTAASESAFVSDADLAKNLKASSIKIKTMEITMGNEVFAEKLELTPANLPVYDNTKTPAENAEALTAKLYDSKKPALKPVDGYKNSVSTIVEEAEYYVDDKTELKAIVVPNAIELNWEDDAEVKAALDAVSIKITLTNDSYFEIGYVENAEEGTPAGINNKAIEKLLQAYTKVNAEDWSTAEILGVFNRASNTQVKLDVQLYGDIFNTDATFNNINSLEAWKNAVDMANWLKREEQTFTLTGNVEFEGGVIPMPANGCKVIANYSEDSKRFNQKFYLTPGEGATGNVEYNEWPEKLESHVYVEVAEGVAFNAAHLIGVKKDLQITNRGTINIPKGTAENINTVEGKPYALVNYGIINVAPYAKITQLDNKNRVNVEYGAYVGEIKGEWGVIAYTVTKDDLKDPSRIAKLTAQTTTGEQLQLAYVNTLVVNKGIKLDFTKVGEPTGSDGDFYAPSAGKPGETANFGDLKDVNFEINGGSILSTKEGEIIEVKDVQMKSGNVGANIKIGGKVDIIEGTNTVDATNIVGALTIADGKGTITSADDINSVKIIKGAYTINTKTITSNIDAVGDNKFNVETINGSVTLNKGQINGATIKNDVTLDGETVLMNVNAENNVTVASGNTSMENVNIDKTLTVATGANAVISVEDAKVGNIVNNGKLTTSVNVYTETVAVNKGATATVAEDKTIWYTKPNAGAYGYIQEGTTNGRILYLGGGEGADNVVLVSSFDQLQAALNNAGEGTTTIALTGDINGNGNVKVLQKENVNIIIDGQNYQYEGIINIDGNGKRNYPEKLHIKNINFYTTSEAAVDFISAPQETGKPYNYAHNITVEKCNFTGNGIGVKVGMRFHSALNIKVKDCTAENVHSLVQARSCEQQTYENCTVTSASEGGINFQNSAIDGAIVKNCNITAGQYGVRIAAIAKTSLTVEGSTINAPKPIVLRSKQAEFTLNNPSSLTVYEE